MKLKMNPGNGAGQPQSPTAAATSPIVRRKQWLTPVALSTRGAQKQTKQVSARAVFLSVIAVAGALLTAETNLKAAGVVGVAAGPNLNAARQGHQVAKLPDGKVMVFGGHGPGFVSLGTAEVYDPATNAFSTKQMQFTHDNSMFAKLNDGRYLLAGGTSDWGVPSYATAELYDPQADSFTAVGSMVRVRAGGSACTLNDGRVLVAGGAYTEASGYGEVFDPASGNFTAAGSLNLPRAGAVLLPTADGKAVVVGGWNPMDWGGYTPMEATPELFDPSSNTFTKMGDYLVAGEPGWRLTDQPGDVSEFRLLDGRYLLVAWRIVSGITENALFTFDPVAKAFARFETTPAFSIPSGTGVCGLAYSVTNNEAYLLLVDYRDGGRQYNVATVSMATHKLLTPATWVVFSQSYGLDACGVSLLNDGRLFVTGGTATPGDQFAMVPYTQLLTPVSLPLVAEVWTAVEFTFPSKLGKTYRIEGSPDMGTWATVESGIAGTGWEIQRFYSTRNIPKRFLRVAEVVP